MLTSTIKRPARKRDPKDSYSKRYGQRQNIKKTAQVTGARATEDDLITTLRNDIKRRSIIKNKTYQQKSVLKPQEAARFRAIFQESQDQFDLLGLVTSDSSRRSMEERENESFHRQAHAKTDHNDLTSLTEHQKHLEGIFAELMEKRQELRGVANKKYYLANQQELQKVMEQLKQSTASFYRKLKHPTASSNQKVQRDRFTLQEALKETMSELGEGRTFGKLTKQVMDRAEEERVISDAQARSQRTNKHLKNLKVSLEKEEEKHRTLLMDKNREIQRLSHKLASKKKMLKYKLKYEQDQVWASLETRERQRRMRINSLQQKIDGVVGQSARERHVSQKNSSFLDKQMNRLAQLQQQWGAKSAREIRKSADILTEFTERATNQRDRLTHNTERYENHQRFQLAKIKEMKEREREKAARKRLKRVMHVAQCKIRFHWKVYQRNKHKYNKKKKEAKKKKKERKKAATTANDDSASVHSEAKTNLGVGYM